MNIFVAKANVHFFARSRNYLVLICYREQSVMVGKERHFVLWDIINFFLITVTCCGVRYDMCICSARTTQTSYCSATRSVAIYLIFFS